MRVDFGMAIAVASLPGIAGRMVRGAIAASLEFDRAAALLDASLPLRQEALELSRRSGMTPAEALSHLANRPRP